MAVTKESISVVTVEESPWVTDTTYFQTLNCSAEG